MTKKEKKLLSATAKVKTEDNQLKVEFAPGCFDHIDVESQEELDALMAEIQNMFANMTPEDLKAQSRPITDEMLEEMDPEERNALFQAMEQHDDQEARKRKLN